MRPAIVSGIVIGDAGSQLLANFSLSLVTFAEVFMKVKSAKFSSCFLKWRMQTVNNQYVPIIPLYCGAWVTPAGEPVYWARSWNGKKKKK